MFNVRNAIITEQEKADYQKEYKRKNKDSINQKKKMRVECPICNIIYTKSNKSRHNNTKYHIDNMK